MKDICKQKKKRMKDIYVVDNVEFNA